MQLNSNLTWDLASNQWPIAINPILANPLNGCLILSFTLITGVNVLNHKLSRQMQGWMILDIDQPINVYRSQPFNNLTLTLFANGPANVKIGVF